MTPSLMRRFAEWIVSKRTNAPAAEDMDREEQRQKEELREKLNSIRQQLEMIDRRRQPRSEPR